MAETIPKLITDVDKYFQYEGSANPTTQDELQAFMKNEHSVVACLTKKLWQPETNYTQGQIVESPNMPVGFYAVALVNGTSYSNEPDWGNGSEDISDGSMKWHMTKGNITVNGVKPDDSGNIQIDNIAHANNADNATKATQDSAGQNINTTYIKGLSVSGRTITYTKGNGTTGTITTQDTTGLSTGSSITVTKSTQQAYTTYTSSNTYTSTSGSGDRTSYQYLTQTGLGAGTYTLQTLLQHLVNRSHTHTTRKVLSNCNCHCDCNCNCSDN